jgi:hemolysin III
MFSRVQARWRFWLGRFDNAPASPRKVERVTLPPTASARDEQLARPGMRRQTWRMVAPVTVYSVNEERANVITHGFAAALSVIGLFVLVLLSLERGDAWHVTGTAVFGVALVMLYTISTLYHLVRRAETKVWLRKCDHAGIFLLIAGSYTPFLLVTLRGTLGWTLFAVIWGLGVVGILLKFWFAGQFRVLSTCIYVGMGWLVLLVMRPLLEVLPVSAVWLLVAGGVAYTGGAGFYLWKRLPYHHAIWHVFVIIGSICHWYVVFEYVVPGSDHITG